MDGARKAIAGTKMVAGSGAVIASQSGHRLGALSDKDNKLLALTPVEELLSLPMLQESQVKDTLHAYQLSKPLKQ